MLAGLLSILLNLLTLTLHSSTPFFEALCITLRASLFEPICITLSTSFFERLLLVILKLLTLLPQLITLHVESFPPVSEFLNHRINLTTPLSEILSEILLLLSKNALLILHRTVHSLRSGLIVTQRINIGFNLPSPFEHVLLEAIVISTELSLPTHLPSLIVTNVTMRAIRTRKITPETTLMLRIRCKRISKDLNVRSGFRELNIHTQHRVNTTGYYVSSKIFNCVAEIPLSFLPITRNPARTSPYFLPIVI